MRGGSWWGEPRATPCHASNHPANAPIHFFFGCRGPAWACEGGEPRALEGLVPGCRPPPITDPALPRFRPVQGVGTGRPLWNSLWSVAPGLAPAGARRHQRPPSYHPRLLPLWDRSRGERGPDRPSAASVRVRGPGLGPVGPEVLGDCAADRGGGDPGPPPAMPQIGRSMPPYIFFLGSRACAGACKGGGRRGLALVVPGCRPPPRTDPALPRFRGSEPVDPCGTRSGPWPRGWHQLVRAGTSAPPPPPPGYCPSGTEVGASADPTSPRRNQSGIGPCQRCGPRTCRT